MATVGLKDLYMAELTETAGVESFGDPVKLAKAIKADISVEVAEGILYADDARDEVLSEFVKGTIKLTVNDLTTDNLATLLGQTVGTDGIAYSGETDEAPYVAIGFRAKKPDGKYRYFWLYKVKFKIPSENFETKNDGINFVTPEIEGEFIKLNNGLWKADFTGLETSTVAAGWFDEVVLPTEA
jgi:phi13 family phage major tail protein